MLGDSRSAEVLEAFTKGYFLDLRLLAIAAIGRTGSERAIRVLKELTADREPARVRVKAAGELARLGFGDTAMLSYCLRAIREPAELLKESAQVSRRAADSDAGSLKLLAIIAMGWFGDEKVVNDLHPLLRDREGPIRVAAAASILRLLKGYKPLTAPAAVPPPAAPPPAVPPPTIPQPAVPQVPAAPAATTSAPASGNVSEVRLAPKVPEVHPAPEGPTTRPQLHTAGGKD
jgi:HEAT repeat protein